MPGIELEIPSRPEYVGVARLVVSTLAASRRDLDDERIEELKVAVSEACTTAIGGHRNGDGHGGAGVLVRCEEFDDRLEVAVIDPSGTFTPGDLAEAPHVTDPEDLEFERGLGVPLIRELVDDVALDTTSEGTVVRLVVRCGPAPMDDDMADLDLDDLAVDLPDDLRELTED